MGQEWILWRRLDRPGHDACRLIHQASGWRLEGSAAFLHENGAVASVAYEVECDREWRTRTGVCGVGSASAWWIYGSAGSLRADGGSATDSFPNWKNVSIWTWASLRPRTCSKCGVWPLRSARPPMSPLHGSMCLMDAS